MLRWRLAWARWWSDRHEVELERLRRRLLRLENEAWPKVWDGERGSYDLTQLPPMWDQPVYDEVAEFSEADFAHLATLLDAPDTPEADHAFWESTAEDVLGGPDWTEPPFSS